MSSAYGNRRKTEQLGMPHGTAAHRLKKLIIFDLLQQLNKANCYRCGKSIESATELSIEHKQSWLDNDVKLFWDLSNIAFSHLSCNSSHGRKGKQSGIAEWVKKNMKKAGAPGTSWCTGCKEFHPVEEFGANRSGRNGLQWECRKYWREKRSRKGKPKASQ